MKRLLIIVSVLAVVIFGFTTASAGVSPSSKLVTHAPPKHRPPPPTPPSTRPDPPPTRSTTTTSTTTSTTTVPTTTRFVVGLADIPSQPYHLRYSMRTDHNLELRWQYDPKPTSYPVSYNTCFFANAVTLCQPDTMQFYRWEDDYVVVLQPRFFPNGQLPLCLMLSVQWRFADGQNSTIISAPAAVCQGTYR